MGIGASIFLIALGAILMWAVSFDVSGIAINTVGLILLLVGIIGLVASMLMMRRARTTVVEEHRRVV